MSFSTAPSKEPITVNTKFYWYSLTQNENVNGINMLTTYRYGFVSKNITLQDLDMAMRLHTTVDIKNVVFLNSMYLGHMTKEEFGG